MAVCTDTLSHTHLLLLVNITSILSLIIECKGGFQAAAIAILAAKLLRYTTGYLL